MTLTMIIIPALIFYTKDQDCVFSKKYIEDKLNSIRELEGVESLVWDDEDNNASILLKSGELINIKLWSCTSYGMEVKAFYSISDMDENNSGLWVERLLNMGKLFLIPSDFQQFSSTINRTDWIKMDLIEPNSENAVLIEHDSYPLFEARVSRGNDFVILFFSYYMN